MGKTKTKKIKKVTVSKNDTKNAFSEFAKLSKKGKVLTVIKWVVGIIIAYSIIIGICAIIGYNRNLNKGFDDLNELIDTYIKALIVNDTSTLDKCIQMGLSYDVDLESKQKAYGEILNSMNININDSISNIKSKPFTGSNILTENTNDLDITNITVYTMNCDYKEIIEGDTFDGTLTYELLVYKLYDKWYVYDFNQTDTIFALSPNNTNLTEIGSNELGYLYINSKWNEVMGDATNESMHSNITYMSNNQNAILALSSYKTDIPYKDYVENYKNALIDNGFNVTAETIKFNDIELTILSYMTNNENNDLSYNREAFFERPMVDGYVHELLFTSTESGQYADAYMETIHFK